MPDKDTTDRDRATRASINNATPKEWDEAARAIRGGTGIKKEGGVEEDVSPGSFVRGKDLSKSITSDGSTASYYELPPNSSELQHLVSHINMNAQIGEIFRACYRYGKVSHSPRLRDAKKIKFYIEAEIARLEKFRILD